MIMREEITFTMGLRGGSFRACHPRYSDLSLEYSRDEGDMAFGQKLSGALKFIDTDYDWVMAQERGVDILVRLEREGILFLGKFTHTDCDIDEDTRKIEVEVEADDAYTWLKAHIDDTFNLVGLAPEVRPIEYRRRACWQYYRRGDKKLTAIMGGDYFEMNATQTASHTDLINKYYFLLVRAESAIMFVALSDAAWRAAHPDVVAADGKLFKGIAPDYLYCDTLAGYRVKLTFGQRTGGNKDGIAAAQLEKKNSSGTWVVLNVGNRVPAYDKDMSVAYSVALGGQYHEENRFYYGIQTGAYFTGIYCRVVHNNANMTPKYDLPDEDIVPRTLNYRYVSLPADSMIKLFATNEYSTKSTEWGLAPDNTNYYQKPKLPSYVYDGVLYPVGKTTWGEYSWWAGFDFTQSIFDYIWWDTVLLRDAYPLSSVLSVLLDAIFKDSGYDISFKETEAYSGFFYGASAGVVELPPHIYITPKTNVLTANYSQKAQKGDITLGQVLNMLRDVFRCYWFIERNSDGTYKLRVEHILWFYKGGSYTSGTPFDIRGAYDVRTGKPWDFGSNKFSFDTAELYGRYEFGWQDECTDYFDGDSINCLAKFVNASSTNKVKIDAFSSDLDYMLLSPEEFNKDGFALLGAGQENLHGYGYNAYQTLKGGVETSKFSLKYPADYDMEVALNISPQLVCYLSCYDKNDVLLAKRLPKPGNKGYRYTMPKGTTQVSYTLSSPSSVTYNVRIYLTSWYDRVEIRDYAPMNVAPQNVRLGFRYIERSWYMYDYPCRQLAAGDGDNRKRWEDTSPWFPIKRAMEQTVRLPWSSAFDPYKGVLSTKGTALVHSVTINLLSLFQELTLRYGTDTK